jgi:D-3-phosphoglycerate dehydrogenase
MKGEEFCIVNAIPMMEETGIKVVEKSSSESGDFSSLVSVEIDTGKGVVSFGGAIFGNAMPRLVLKDGLRLEGYLDGHLLFIDHKDVPGVIGAIGNLLAKENINIAHLSVGRRAEAKGEDALAILSLDSVPSQKAVEQVKELENITKVQAVDLPAKGEYPAWMA